MRNYLNERFDPALSELRERGLSWLPWVGKEYSTSGPASLLVVGETHYGNPDGEIPIDVQDKNHACDTFTREVIDECQLQRDWSNRTLENIKRVFVGKRDVDGASFWTQISFYNFIQRVMKTSDERPTWDDFYNSWEIFTEIARILKPTHCVFIGVSACNSFDLAMENLKHKHDRVKRVARIGTAYGRIASFTLDNSQSKLIAIQHAGKMFSWERWHEFLQSCCPVVTSRFAAE